MIAYAYAWGQASGHENAPSSSVSGQGSRPTGHDELPTAGRADGDVIGAFRIDPLWHLHGSVCVHRVHRIIT
jgi:hypothetical protein